MDHTNNSHKAIRSVEHFHHFRCTHCNGWWGIGDAPNERQNWFCPWCGKENTYLAYDNSKQ